MRPSRVWVVLIIVLVPPRDVSSQGLSEGHWTPYGNASYYLSPSKLSYPYARNYCQTLGGDLPVVKTQKLYEFLQSGNVRMWIGLDDLVEEGLFRWVDGTLQGMSFPSEFPAQGPDGGGEECVELRFLDNEWVLNDAKCNRDRRVVCERFTDIWITVGSFDYFFSSPSSSWSYSQARSFCQNQGGDLAQPRTQLLNTLLTVPNTWIGLNDLDVEGTFQWVDGTEQGSGFPAWGKGSPDDANGNEDCVHINSIYEWHDTQCEVPQNFICEKYRVPEPDVPVRILATTATPFGKMADNSQYFCLVSKKEEEQSNTTTKRRVKLSGENADDTLTVPGTTVRGSMGLAINQSLPSSQTAAGVFSCTTRVRDGHHSSVYLTILSYSRAFQPTNGRFSRRAIVGDNVTLQVTGSSPLTKWRIFDNRRDGGFLIKNDRTLNHTILFVTKEDANVYGSFPNNNENVNYYGSFIRLIVTECAAGRWFPPDCLGICDICYNGGVCHEQSGTCICPPGFYGKNCLSSCPANRFGWDCEFECGSGKPLDICAGSQICLPDPYGCNCLAGYTGVYCNKTCENNTFGVDCLQTCHCSGRAACDMFTGKCPGDCEEGWSGGNCQVPPLCLSGYYGDNCTEICNCLDNQPCKRETGSCLFSMGQCAPRFTHDINGPKDNCNTVSGCFRSCTKTCHCSGGATDCNSVNGMCQSGECSPRWMGDNCQTDRFHIAVVKSNPRTAIIHCSFNDRLSLQESRIYLSVGPAGKRTTILADVRQNASFMISDIDDDEEIYCYFGDLTSDALAPYGRVPDREFYVLPRLENASFVVVDVGSSFVIVRWREWDRTLDSGDGPVIGYNIYTTANGQEERVHLVPHPAAQSAENGSTSDNGTTSPSMREFTVTDLRPATEYSLSLAVVREGLDGVGPPGPTLTLTTSAKSTTAISPTSPSSPTNQSLVGNESVDSSGAIAAGAGVSIALVIIMSIVVIIFCRKRRRTDKGESIDGHAEVPLPSHIPTPDEGHINQRHQQAERRPISLVHFPDFVKKHRYTEFFSAEYNELPPGDLYPQTVARKDINVKKNRYKNILPYDDTRVTLSALKGNSDLDYFNASFIPNFDKEGAYIASQGPNKASVDDFWRMVWEWNVRTIGMFTRLKEGPKIKCHQYWPDGIGDIKCFGEVEVRLHSIATRSDGMKRILAIRKGLENRMVCQFQYTAWPDKDVPKHPSSLLKFIKEVQADHRENTAPLLIHCSAGVGRTGVVIGIDSIVANAKKTGVVDVFNFVSLMRQSRPFMVQLSEQYAFLYQAILEDLMWKDTEITTSEFSTRLSKLKQTSSTRQQSPLSAEFEDLSMLCPDAPPSRTRSGKMPRNRAKNRYGNLVPLERNRVMIPMPDAPEDYINASFVKGARCSFITTQMPMPTTVSDFWSMILRYKPSCIVMLNELDQDKSCAMYWEESGELQIGPYVVSTFAATEYYKLTIRTLFVRHEPSQDEQTVQHYQFRGWPLNRSMNKEGAKSIIDLIEAVRSSTPTETEFGILVHCMNGVGRTGVFCAAMECIAQILEDNTVDVFQSVKILRADRSGLVQNEDEHLLIYEVIDEYLHRNEYDQPDIPYQEDHTYDNTDRSTNENLYEVTGLERSTFDNPQQEAEHAYGNVEIASSQPKRKEPLPTESVYENYSN